MRFSKSALIVLDGFGWRKEKKGNAVAKAKKPFFDELMKKNPWCLLEASGPKVGLPEHGLGGSEVGHTNLGAGRVVLQDLLEINQAIKDKSFFKNEALKKAFEHARKNTSKLHLIGLVSNGGVHSHIDHLIALLEAAKKEKLNEVWIHAFSDGRDVKPKSALEYFEKLENEIKRIGIGKIASISGRSYAMDRDNRWFKAELAYRIMTEGYAQKAKNVFEAIKKAYEKDETDEFITPTLIDKEGLIKDNDSIIFFNFRSDRARELTKVFLDKHFNKFKRKLLSKILFTTLTQFDSKIETNVMFEPKTEINSIPEVMDRLRIPQLRAAESEKYPHVTFFFNCLRQKPFETETRIIVPSPHVKSYDLKPEMSCIELTNKTIDAIEKNTFGFVLVNYANADMIGHTGNFKATVKSIEIMDRQLERLVTELQKKDFEIIICADHGNADTMLDEKGGILTSHSLEKVPCIVISQSKVKLKIKEGCLGNVAPTLLELMHLNKPSEMIGALI